MYSSTNFVQIIALFTVFLTSLTFVNCSGDECNCFTKETEITPFKVTLDNGFKNEVEKNFYNQKLYNVTCREENAPCFNEVYKSHTGTAVCVTSYSYVQLNYRNYNPDDSSPQKVTIGVGCSCKIMSNDNDPDEYIKRYLQY